MGRKGYSPPADQERHRLQICLIEAQTRDPRAGIVVAGPSAGEIVHVQGATPRLGSSGVQPPAAPTRTRAVMPGVETGPPRAPYARPGKG